MAGIHAREGKHPGIKLLGYKVYTRREQQSPKEREKKKGNEEQQAKKKEEQKDKCLAAAGRLARLPE